MASVSGRYARGKRSRKPHAALRGLGCACSPGEVDIQTAARRFELTLGGVDVPKSVILSGGGIKTAVAAARIAAEHDLYLVHLNFGQRSAPAELTALTTMARSLRSARVLDLDLPHPAQLEQHVTGKGNARGSVIADPARNRLDAAPALCWGLFPVLLSVAVQCARRVGATTVVTGVSELCPAPHLGLAGALAKPGNLRSLLHSYDLMVDSLGSHHQRVRIEAPLIDLAYARIVQLAQRFEVPLEQTWTCDQTGPRPCRRCDRCRDRGSAFAEATLPDPLVESRRARMAR